jgi:hypothetical protein
MTARKATADPPFDFAQGDDNKEKQQRGVSRETNVNSRGPTTFLWIKHLFGFCGELW